MPSSSKYPSKIGNYLLLETLGSGFSGAIFRAKHIFSDKVVALKLQDVNHSCPTNRYERGFYPSLQGGEGMPTLYASGVEGKWDFLVIDLLGASLDSLFRKSGKDRMDLRSVCCIAMQVISRLETMHNRGILHRDIQLGNCVIGLPPNEGMIYMIDFGFSKRYIDPATKRHIPDSTVKRDFIGNYWFTSVGVHCRGKVPSRRDDLEAAALMFIHLLTPNGLPWTRNGIPKTDSAHDRIKRAKRDARPEQLCRDLPSEFEEFLRYCRRLQFAEKPDYQKWIKEFSDLAQANGFPTDDAFVWPPPVTLPTSPSKKKPSSGSVDRVLNDLAKLDLNDRPVLGDRKNINKAAQIARQDSKDASKASGNTRKKSAPLASAATLDVIEISDDSVHKASRDSQPARVARLNKAQQIERLTRTASDATDNGQLSDVVEEFYNLLESQRAKNLTKEGFVFLDTVHKQLSDSSVFVAPLRESRTRSNNQSENNAPRHLKLDALARLKREVRLASNNLALARYVADFETLINKSAGRTVTKDGMAFLQGLTARLRELGRT